MSYEGEKIEQDKLEEESAFDAELRKYQESISEKPSCFKKQLGNEACFNNCPVKEECYSGYFRG